MDELVKLDSLDILESRNSVSRLQKRLASGRDPTLLSDLVEFYFARGSRRAVKVLTGLKNVQSQVSVQEGKVRFVK